MPVAPELAPVGVVLAGGRARRLGGAGKATLVLAGRPLLLHALDSLRAVLAEVAVVAKPETALPALPPGVACWREPAAPQHPLVGIRHALAAAGGRAVVVVAGDMPLVPASVVAALAAGRPAAPVLVAAAGGAIEPLLARYEPQAAGALAAAPPDAPLRAVVARLAPEALGVAPEALLNVNTPEDLVTAQAVLAARPPGR